MFTERARSDFVSKYLRLLTITLIIFICDFKKAGLACDKTE